MSHVTDDPFMDPHWQKPAKRRRRTGPFIGCPVPWFAWVFPLAKGGNQLGLALYLYRRCCIYRSDAVTVPNSEVTELLGLSRWAKHRALLGLEQAGVIRIIENGRRTVKVQLYHWPNPPC